MSNQVSLREIRRGDRLEVHNRSRGICLAAELQLCLDPWRRLRGLLGRPAPPEEQAWLLRPCGSVHTFFMAYPIDVAFLDGDGKLVGACPSLRPFRVSGHHGNAWATLELAAGRLERTGTSLGDEIVFIRAAS